MIAARRPACSPMFPPQMLAAHRPLLSAALVAGALGLPVATGAASTPASAPDCTPAVLDASARLGGAVTVSPMPGAADASPRTQISFLGVPARELTQVAVVGSMTGTHSGEIEPYSQGDGGSFVPKTAFRPGERVSVTVRLALPGGVQSLHYQFTIGVPDVLPTVREGQHRLPRHGQQQFVSRPDLQPPIVSVHRRSSRQAPGDALLAPYGVPAQSGPMILDGAGRLLWFDPVAPPDVATNLRVQRWHGAPVLTWWQGTITTHGFGLGVDEIVGSDYRTIAVVKAGNGMQADLHEFDITPAGTALLTAYDPIRCNLAALGGSANGAVTDSLLQEIDIKTGLVMYEWRSVDHIALPDSYSSPRASSTSRPFDFFHLNSVNRDADGSLLVSSRNTWAVDKIDDATGQLRWTLGGKHSSFTAAPGASTAYQHDARPLGSGALSLFDNGASPQVHLQSRGVVLAIDPRSGAVSVRQQFLHPGHRLLAESQGNMQALPDGNWFIGWGQEPDLSEFSAHGTLLFDASMPAGYESYRAFRFAWRGRPATVPSLSVAAARDGSGERAYVSWNGATGVARWELLEGASATALEHVGSVGRDGFETAIPLLLDAGRRYVAVRALDAAGAVLATSPAVALPAP